MSTRVRRRAQRSNSAEPRATQRSALPNCGIALALLAVTLRTWPCAAQALVPPPSPSTLEPTYHLEVHGAAILPIERQNLCPAGFGCVLGGGFGAGAFIERRAADGLGLLVGYQVWLLDSGGVYEVGAVHTLRLGVRWIVDANARVHPFFELMAGAVLITDPGEARTGGGLVSLGAGLEVELTETVAVTVGLDAWAVAVGAFRTRDGAARATDFGVNLLSQLRVGLGVVLDDPNH